MSASKAVNKSTSEASNNDDRNKSLSHPLKPPKIVKTVQYTNFSNYTNHTDYTNYSNFTKLH